MNADPPAPGPPTVGGTTRVAAVIGDPVAHSLSPAIHNAAYRALGLDWIYVAFTVGRAHAAAAVRSVTGLGLGGLNVTMPHKEAAAAECDELTPAAARLRSVNTVVPLGDGRLRGDSTDGAGFLDSLDARGVDVAGRDVVVVGAGGAARAVVRALGERGARVTVAARRLDAGAEAAALAPGASVVQFAVPTAERTHRAPGPPAPVATGHGPGGAERAWADRVSAADVVVNATPVGMDGHSCPVPAGALRSGQTVVDLVYEPLETPLLAAARAAGADAVDGLGMLVHQAARAFEQFTGIEAPIDVMARVAGTPGGSTAR